MCTCHPPETHLRGRGGVAVCGRWSHRLTDNPRHVNCVRCRGSWQFTAAQKEAER